MIWLYIAIGYVLFFAFLIRFFQAVHRWDDEIKEMQDADSVDHKRREQVPHED